jgi:hypothetical protein
MIMKRIKETIAGFYEMFTRHEEKKYWEEMDKLKEHDVGLYRKWLRIHCEVMSVLLNGK